MNKILADYIGCVRKRLLTDQVGGVDAAAVIAAETWNELITTKSRNIIRDTPALREALSLNGFEQDVRDAELRVYIKEEASR